MNMKELIEQNRSCRRFDSSVSIPRAFLLELINLTRLTASARNMQPLRYVLCDEKSLMDALFPLLSWAGYLREWAGPEPDERPSAYILVCKENELADGHVLFDAGLAVQSILLGATAQGFGGCIIGAMNKAKINALIQLPEAYELLYVIALGKPAETVVIEELTGTDIKYWRDEKGTHHVPKRNLNDLIIKI